MLNRGLAVVYTFDQAKTVQTQFELNWLAGFAGEDFQLFFFIQIGKIKWNYMTVKMYTHLVGNCEWCTTRGAEINCGPFRST